MKNINNKILKFFSNNKKGLLSIILVFFSLLCNAQNWDINLLKEINLHRYRSLDEVFRIITNYASPIAYTVPFFLLALSFIIKDGRLQTRSAYCINASVVALAISESLKHTVNRPRPFVTYSFIDKITSAGSPSFPSGHTCDAFTLAFSLSFAYPKWYIILPAILWAMFVGYSRMDLGVHYPTDIIGSIVIAVFSSFVCYMIFKRKEKWALPSENMNIK